MHDTIYLVLTIAGTLVAIIVSLAGLFAGIGYYKQGKADAKGSEVNSANDTIELFKNQAEGFKADLRKIQNDFDNFRKEVAVKEEAYKKTISQQEDLIKTYAAILQNRNPELEATLKEIRDFLKSLQMASDHNKGILDKQVIREAKIDDTSVNRRKGD